MYQRVSPRINAVVTECVSRSAYLWTPNPVLIKCQYNYEEGIAVIRNTISELSVELDYLISLEMLQHTLKEVGNATH